MSNIRMAGLQIPVLALLMTATMAMDESPSSQKPIETRTLTKRGSVYGHPLTKPINDPICDGSEDKSQAKPTSTPISYEPELKSQTKPQVHFKLSENKVYTFNADSSPVAPVPQDKDPNKPTVKANKPQLKKQHYRTRTGLGQQVEGSIQTIGLDGALNASDCATNLDGQ